MDIDDMRKKIEAFDKIQQLEILKIFIKHNININENKSGIFINLSTMKPEVIDDIKQYLEHINIQENTLLTQESKQEEYSKQYFS